MAKEVIQNVYDGPHAPAKKQPTGPVISSLDYANSDIAEVIDTGIRETIRGLRLSILAMGLGLAKLKAQGLYADLYSREDKPFHSMNDYLEELSGDMQIDRATIYSWLHIGEAFVKYKKELERIEFSDEDGPSKLLHVERALESHKKQDVFKNAKDMSLRKFIEYSRGDKAAAPASTIKVVGNKIYVGDTLAVTFAEELDGKTRSFLERVNVQAGEALEAGEVLYMTRLYDVNELRGFAAAAERLKKELRIERKKKKK